MSENHRRTVRPLCSELGRPTFAVLMGTADRSILNMALEHAFLNCYEEGVSWKNGPLRAQEEVALVSMTGS